MDAKHRRVNDWQMEGERAIYRERERDLSWSEYNIQGDITLCPLVLPN